MALLFEPFSPLFELTRAVDRQLAGGNGRMVPSFIPAADVVVTDDDVTVHMDVPGLRTDNVEIELVDDVLTVRGERTLPAMLTDEQQEKGAWQRIERGFGKFERTLRVPEGLDADQISADLADGVLTLHIPKPEARKPHRIQITTGEKHSTIEGTATEQRELAGAAA